MLLLRAVLGVAVLVEGEGYVGEPNRTPAALLIGFAAFAFGGMLLIGFLTPIVSAVVAAGAAGVGLSLFPACTPSLFDSRISLIFGLTMLVTIIAIGPGAFSADARVFGRREIIIPPPIAPFRR